MHLTDLCRRGLRYAIYVASLILLTAAGSLPARASELELKLPDLHQAIVLGVNGWSLLTVGLLVSALGFVFGIAMYMHLRNLPVHESMLEISELIYETCKTYLITQGKFLMILEIFIGAVIVLYFGVLTATPAFQVVVILLFSVVGIIGSYGVAWFGI